jgi:hypothetical protein
MPPFQSRSTGARRIARISSFGVICATSCSMPSARRTWSFSGIDLRWRDHTPPPSEISEVS